MTVPIVVAFDPATGIFNLPNYRVVSVSMVAGWRRQVIVEADQPPGCPRLSFFECTAEVPPAVHARAHGVLTLPEVDELSPRMLGIDEHRFRSVGYVCDSDSSHFGQRDQVLGIVDARDHRGAGDWLFTRRLQWRLGVSVVALEFSAAFRKALRMWLRHTGVAVD